MRKNQDCSCVHLSITDSAKRWNWRHKRISHCPSFSQHAPVCLEPWLQVADAAEPLKFKGEAEGPGLSIPRALLILPLTLDSGGLLQKTATSGLAQGPGRPSSPLSPAPGSSRATSARGHGARAPGGGSKLVIGHLQELRVHIPTHSPLGLNRNL